MPDRPRIGIISFAHMHAFSYLNVLLSLPDIEIIGIADDDAERGQQVAAKAGVPYLESEEALLEEADGVIVTTENIRHREKVLRAAQAGVDVMCEKPLATTMGGWSVRSRAGNKRDQSGTKSRWLVCTARAFWRGHGLGPHCTYG